MAPAAEELTARVVELSDQNVFACYQCGCCTAGCPFGLAPQQVMRRVQLGQVRAALALDTTWQCASCLTCVAACPKGLQPPRVMRALRDVADERHLDVPAHGHRLRTWVLANNHRFARLGSATAPLSNRLLSAPGADVLQQTFLGVHRERALPPFAGTTFPTWFARHVPRGDGRRGPVLLFHDTFMDYNFPQTGMAATALLELAGYAVELTDSVCCGRVLISKGRMRQAAGHARENVRRLFEQRGAEGVPIVGCEPSCLLTLRAEYLELAGGADAERARAVAARALLLDEFLDGLAERGELDLRFDLGERAGTPVLFHGHCHQKALARPDASVRLLRLAGYDAEMVNAACCGMAGSFGYEREHYEQSRHAAERGVLPALRARPEAAVVVMGVSCRQQIEHFAGRPTRHLAEALLDAVAVPEPAAG